MTEIIKFPHKTAKNHLPCHSEAKPKNLAGANTKLNKDGRKPHKKSPPIGEYFFVLPYFVTVLNGFRHVDFEDGRKRIRVRTYINLITAFGFKQVKRPCGVITPPFFGNQNVT